MIDGAVGVALLADLRHLEEHAAVDAKPRPYRKISEIKAFHNDVFPESAECNIGAPRPERFNLVEIQETTCRCQFPAWASPSMPYPGTSFIDGTSVFCVPFRSLVHTAITFPLFMEILRAPIRANGFYSLISSVTTYWQSSSPAEAGTHTRLPGTLRRPGGGVSPSSGSDASSGE